MKALKLLTLLSLTLPHSIHWIPQAHGYTYDDEHSILRQYTTSGTIIQRQMVIRGKLSDEARKRDRTAEEQALRRAKEAAAYINERKNDGNLLRKVTRGAVKTTFEKMKDLKKGDSGGLAKGKAGIALGALSFGLDLSLNTLEIYTDDFLQSLEDKREREIVDDAVSIFFDNNGHEQSDGTQRQTAEESLQTGILGDRTGTLVFETEGEAREILQNIKILANREFAVERTDELQKELIVVVDRLKAHGFDIEELKKDRKKLKAALDSIGTDLDKIKTLIKTAKSDLSKKIEGAKNDILDAIDKSAEETGDALKKLEQLVKETAIDKNHIKRILFNQASPSEQVEMMDRGFYTPDTKEAANIRNDVTIDEIVEYGLYAAQGLQSLAIISHKLAVHGKIDPIVVERLSQAVTVTSALVNATDHAFRSKPNYFAAALSLVGLVQLFGPKPIDIDLVRHEQIMDGITALREGQQMILDNQRMIMNLVGEFRALSIGQHTEVMASLGALHRKANAALTLILDQARQGIDNCSSFLASKSDETTEDRSLNFTDPAMPGFITDSFSFYEEMRSYFEGNYHHWEPCSKTLSSLASVETAGTDKKFPEILKAEHYALVKGGSALTLIDQVMSPLLEFLIENLDQIAKVYQTSPAAIIEGLLTPSVTIDDLEQKIAALPEVKGKYAGTSHQKTVDHIGDLYTVLSPTQVWKVGLYSSHLHSFWDFSPSPLGELMTEEELVAQIQAGTTSSMNPPWTEGRQWLRRFGEYVDVASIQQALIGGDLLLPFFVATLHGREINLALPSGENREIPAFEEAGTASTILGYLRHNPHLARNVLALYARYRVRGLDVSLERYDRWIQTGNEHYLERVYDPLGTMDVTFHAPNEDGIARFDQEHELTRSDNQAFGLQMVFHPYNDTFMEGFEGRAFHVPSAEQIRDGLLSQPIVLQHLQDTRYKLTEAKGQYFEPRNLEEAEALTEHLIYEQLL